MNEKETNQLINFHNLAIELRRLKKGHNPIPTFALLINQNINPTINYSNFYQHPQSEILINLCKIVLNRFSTHPATDSFLLIAMIKFSGNQKLGQLILFDILISNYSILFDENLLTRLYNSNPEFLKNYFLSRIYSNPQSLNPNSIESFLPLQNYSLIQLGQNADMNSSSFLRFVVKFLFEKSFEHISDCLYNEKLFNHVANLVFYNPSFFEFSQILFPNQDNLKKLFEKLKETNPTQFLTSFLTFFTNRTLISDIVSNLYTAGELIAHSTLENLNQLLLYLRTYNRWDCVELLYNKDHNWRFALSELLLEFYKSNQVDYLRLYAQYHYDFFLNNYVIDEISQGHISVENFVYLFDKPELALQLITQDPYYIQSLLQNSDTITDTIRLLKSNPELIQRKIIDLNKIIPDIYQVNNTLFFDLFDDPQDIEAASFDLINFVMSNQPQMKFPSLDFFIQLSQKVNIMSLLPRLYESNPNLFYHPEWRKMLASMPQILFATIQLNSYPQDCYILFIQYIHSQVEVLSNDIDKFCNLITFFKTTEIERFAYSNLALSTQLVLLDCFANSCHLLFNTGNQYTGYQSNGTIDSCDIHIGDNKQKIELYYEFFQIMAKTNVLSQKSHSNDIIKKNLLLPLANLDYDLVQIGQMTLALDIKNLLEIDLEIIDPDQIPTIENVSVQMNPLLAPESLHLIATYIEKSLSDKDEILRMDSQFLKHLSEMIFSALSSTRSPIWMNADAVVLLCSILERLQAENIEIMLTPAFLQALAFMTNGEKEGIPNQNAELVEIHRRLAEIVALSSTFENALLELL